MQVELEAVRPGEGEGSEEELRLSLALLPLRLRIDQAVVDFCQVGSGPCPAPLLPAAPDILPHKTPRTSDVTCWKCVYEGVTAPQLHQALTDRDFTLLF